MYSKWKNYCVVFLCAGLLVSSACSSSNPAGPSGNDSSSSATSVCQ
jgi:hypothetical protein